MKDKEVWRAAVHEVAELDMTYRLNNSMISFKNGIYVCTFL